MRQDELLAAPPMFRGRRTFPPSYFITHIETPWLGFQVSAASVELVWLVTVIGAQARFCWLFWEAIAADGHWVVVNIPTPFVGDAWTRLERRTAAVVLHCRQHPAHDRLVCLWQPLPDDAGVCNLLTFQCHPPDFILHFNMEAFNY